MIDILVNIIIAIAAPIALINLAHKRKTGFLIFLIVETCYIYIALANHQYGLLIVALFYLVFDTYAWYKWREDEKLLKETLR